MAEKNLVAILIEQGGTLLGITRGQGSKAFCTNRDEFENHGLRYNRDDHKALMHALKQQGYKAGSYQSVVTPFDEFRLNAARIFGCVKSEQRIQDALKTKVQGYLDIANECLVPAENDLSKSDLYCNRVALNDDGIMTFDVGINRENLVMEMARNPIGRFLVGMTFGK